MEVSGSGHEVDGYAGLVFDVDPSAMEPYQRCRANTWHGRARVVTDDDRRSTLSNRVDSPAEPCDSSSFGALNSDAAAGPTRTAGSRKPVSRKNAWGNLSYADLITQAIESSPDKRLTLAQIYDWMVTNVPFFKDKGDSNSSAGWKNSIRHNLSLHSRFMRVQNEGAGKSSWWVVNPDAVARATKTPRRPRAFTMDTKAYERQRRSRAQRQSRDFLTRAPAAVQRPVTSTAVVDSSSLVIEEPRDPFGLEYRTRASSFGGRLSPIDARPEPDTVDSMDYSPLVRCHYEVPSNHFLYAGDGQETLSETLADILAGDLNMSDISSTSSVTNPPSQPGYVEGGYDPLMPPLHPIDFYRDPISSIRGCYEPGSSSHGSSSDVSFSAHYGCVNPSGAGGVGNVLPKGSGIVNRALNVDHVVTGSMPNLSQLLTAPPCHMSRVGELKPKSCMFEDYRSHPRDMAAAPSDSMTVKASSCGMVTELGGTNNETGCYGSLVARPVEERPTGQRLDQTAVARILAERPHLMWKMQMLIQLKRQQLAAELHQHQFQQQQPVVNQPVVNHPVDAGNCETDFQLHASCTTIPQSTATSNDLYVAAETSRDSSTNSFFPSDLDLNGVDFGAATMDCDIDQVIHHELALDGKLDFMFDSLPTPTK